MIIKSTAKTLLLASITGAYSNIALTQDAAAAGSPQTSANSNESVLETVLVTAQRREERLVDVPISMTALSSDELQRSGVTATTDLERVTPGLELTYNGGFLQPAIRGVSSQGSSAGDSSNVAFYLDGVYMPSQPGQAMDLPDVQQVQVLKGPQGTLYGQNATGGAIIISTVTPNLKEKEGKLSLSYGNYNDISLSGYYAGPVSERVAVSIAAAKQDRDGFRDDLVYGGEDAGLRSSLVRGKVLFDATEAASFTISAYSSERKDSSAYSGKAYDNRSVGYLAAAGLPPGSDVPQPDWDETATSRPADTDNSTWGASLLAEFNFEQGTLSSTTSYTESDVTMEVDVDYSFFHYGDVTVRLEQDFFVQEFNFVSEQLGKWQYSTGLFYLNGTEEYVPNTFRIAQNPGPAPAVSEADANMTPIQYTYGSIDKEIYAAYVEANYSLSDQLTLTLGGRYSDEEQTVVSNWQDQTAMDTEESPFSPATFTQFTPRAVMTYALSDTSNVYASYSEGFKSGYIGFDGQREVDPEQLVAYEVGYKGDLGHTVSVTAAIYHYEYTDLQVASYEAPNYVYSNAAEASIDGAEFNGSWKAAPGLILSAGVSLLDASYDSFKGATAYEWNPAGGNVKVNFDASGKEMIRAPELTGFINADYSVQTDMGEFSAFASAYYNDGYNLELSGAIAQESYTMLDGELTFRPAQLPNFSVALWGHNLTNEAVLQSLLETPLASGVSYGPPRTFGLRATLDF